MIHTLEVPTNTQRYNSQNPSLDPANECSPPCSMHKNLLLLLFSTLISLGFLEVALRVIMPERLAFVPTLLNNDTTYVPNQTERSQHLEWDHEVRINADGFRNDRTLPEIPGGTTLVLGDSFTEGKGVALHDSYPKQLEALYQTDNVHAHVYNAGHYDTA